MILKSITDILSIREQTKECIACELRQTCTKPVPCAGNLLSSIIFVGEAPGADEDVQGLPFVGQSGQLLTETCAYAGFNIWEECLISNTTKCRPPSNRTPTPSEAGYCASKWLSEEIKILQPKFVVLVGRVAQSILLPDTKLKNGEVFITSMSTIFGFLYHPSYWLRNGGMFFSSKHITPILRDWYALWKKNGWLVRKTKERSHIIM